MSILTGASAAALYGNRGSNGVIVITTRKGTDDKTRVRYSNNTTFMSPFVMQDFQNTYGRASESSYESWGHKAAVPYSYDPKDFFQTGVLENNSLSVSAGNQRSQTYISTAATNSKGIMPNNKYEKYNFTFRNSTTLVEDKLEADVSFNYTRQIDKNMYGQGQSYNPLVPLYLFPPSDDIGKYIVYERYNEERNMNTQYWPYGNLGMGLQNPYWIAYRNLFNTKRDKYTFTAVLNYNVTEWLSLKGRVRYDKLESMWTRRLYASTDEVFAVNENGNYIKMKSTGGSLYADFLIDIDKKINDDFRINCLLGASREDYSYNFLMNQGP
ncbi:MAG: SusC/RagA family TonB-linked outer membrane protein, partial [Rikenellaceae bacterium]|nr:SusC/RagA family TonB-linked outer membrane protein [Rikenellaceae bacterium]